MALAKITAPVKIYAKSIFIQTKPIIWLLEYLSWDDNGFWLDDSNWIDSI